MHVSAGESPWHMPCLSAGKKFQGDERMRTGVCGWSISVLLLTLGLASPAAAQLQTGDIYFTAHDRDNQPMPGAVVTLSGSQGFTVRVTDAAGEARFFGLAPDSGYFLTATCEDCNPVSAAGVMA